jgi:hypothetical protein
VLVRQRFGFELFGDRRRRPRRRCASARLACVCPGGRDGWPSAIGRGDCVAHVQATRTRAKPRPSCASGTPPRRGSSERAARLDLIPHQRVRCGGGKRVNCRWYCIAENLDIRILGVRYTIKDLKFTYLLFFVSDMFMCEVYRGVCDQNGAAIHIWTKLFISTLSVTQNAERGSNTKGAIKKKDRAGRAAAHSTLAMFIVGTDRFDCMRTPPYPCIIGDRNCPLVEASPPPPARSLYHM